LEPLTLYVYDEDGLNSGSETYREMFQLASHSFKPFNPYSLFTHSLELEAQVTTELSLVPFLMHILGKLSGQSYIVTFISQQVL